MLILIVLRAYPPAFRSMIWRRAGRLHDLLDRRAPLAVFGNVAG
jgi:hypothetical protein